MPIGSQEGGTGPQAIAYLKTEGESVEISLRDLAIVLEDVSERYDSAMVDDVLATVATALLDRTGAGNDGSTDGL